jgi:hypothetical protein|tara:strand:+ start:294 stop:497 length:204 start_codon:yes stop_codon:yes gene_type:complete
MKNAFTTVLEVREHFDKNFRHIDMGGISDELIASFLDREYIKNAHFVLKIDCLYDYILSQSLTHIDE